MLQLLGRVDDGFERQLPRTRSREEQIEGHRIAAAHYFTATVAFSISTSYR